MPAIHDLLSAAKDASGIPSNYRLARVLDVTDHTVGNWQNGRALPNEQMTIRLCELAGVDPAPFLAEMAAGRAKDDDTRSMWLAIAERLRQAPLTVAAAMMIALGAASAPMPSQASSLSIQGEDCALCQPKRRRAKAARSSLGRALKKARAH